MKRALLATLAALALVLSLNLTAADASNFIVTCGYSHSAQEDPIVSPGVQSAHLHDFFGNRSTNKDSTYETMRAAGTTCNDSGDTAGYWVPAAYRADGTRLMPSRAKAYYYRKVSGTLTAPPADFKAIAGDSHATSAPSTKILFWGCGTGSGISKVTAPPNCTGHSTFLEVHILFPDCLGTPMVYSTMNGGVCPSGYTRMPQLVVAVFYPSSNPDYRGLTLASGSYYTMHADFWNTWDQARFEARVATL